jgi:hypothetical protein
MGKEKLMMRTLCDRCSVDITMDADYSLSLEQYDKDGDPIEKTELDLCNSCAEIVKLALEAPSRKKS